MATDKPTGTDAMTTEQFHYTDCYLYLSKSMPCRCSERMRKHEAPSQPTGGLTLDHEVIRDIIKEYSKDNPFKIARRIEAIVREEFVNTLEKAEVAVASKCWEHEKSARKDERERLLGNIQHHLLIAEQAEKMVTTYSGKQRANERVVVFKEAATILRGD